MSVKPGYFQEICLDLSNPVTVRSSNRGKGDEMPSKTPSSRSLSPKDGQKNTVKGALASRRTTVAVVTIVTLISTLLGVQPLQAQVNPLCGGRTATITSVNGFASGTTRNDVIIGSSGADVIHGNGGNDIICGLGGDDLLIGGSGTDTIYGGDGIDVLDGGTDADRIYGGNGDDIIQGDFGNDRLYGEKGDDIIDGEYGNDLILGGNGGDNLGGGPGVDRLVGGNGMDNLNGGNGNDLLQGGNHNDVILGWNGDDHIQGQRGFDRLLGGNGDDLIEGNDGDDNLQGQGGDDILLGGQDNDHIIDFVGINILDGGIDNDRITTGPCSSTSSNGCATELDSFNATRLSTVVGGGGNDICYGYAPKLVDVVSAELVFEESCETHRGNFTPPLDTRLGGNIVDDIAFRCVNYIGSLAPNGREFAYEESVHCQAYALLINEASTAEEIDLWVSEMCARRNGIVPARCSTDGILPANTIQDLFLTPNPGSFLARRLAGALDDAVTLVEVAIAEDTGIRQRDEWLDAWLAENTTTGTASRYSRILN